MKRKLPEGHRASDSSESDWMEPFMEPPIHVKLNAELVSINETERLIADSENPAVAAHTFLNLTNAKDLMREGASQRAGRKRGGKKTADKNGALAKQSHDQWIAAAKAMVGTDPHNLSAKVAKRFGKTDKAVRPVLQQAGLVPIRPKKEK